MPSEKSAAIIVPKMCHRQSTFGPTFEKQAPLCRCLRVRNPMAGEVEDAACFYWGQNAVSRPFGLNGCQAEGRAESAQHLNLLPRESHLHSDQDRAAFPSLRVCCTSGRPILIRSAGAFFASMSQSSYRQTVRRDHTV